MASRRNELSAYTFSRRRTVAAFLQPSSGGNEEDAPRALRAVVPSIIVGVLAVAGAGAYGMIKPSAPVGWQKANAVIVGKQSTTRYVMLDGALHPVLNIASARLLLTPGSTVVSVDDSVLDSGKVPHGSLVGIPFAPDSLPTAQDAGTAKVWAYCEQPSSTAQGTTNQKLFVLDGKDTAAVGGSGQLDAGHAMYVQGPDGTTYLVDATGTYHQLSAGHQGSATDRIRLATAAFGATVGAPQAVSADWLATLHQGDPIVLPNADIPGYGTSSNVSLGSGPVHVGDIYQVQTDSGQYLHYVVEQDGVHPVSDFTNRLLEAVDPNRTVPTVPDMEVAGANTRPAFEGTRNWPTALVAQANQGGNGNVACSVYTGTASAAGVPQLRLWTGADYPVNSTSGTAGVYVTPGSGLLYRQVSGTSTTTGSVDLLTDTGLRYPIQMNNDSSVGGASPTPNPNAGTDGGSTDGSSDGTDTTDDAQARLGYGSVPLNPVPFAWSSLLSSGPNLNAAAAGQQQDS